MLKSSYFKFIIISIIGLTVLSGCSKKPAVDEARAKEVVVYTYDSFISEWGPGAVIADAFTAKTGYTVSWVDCGDGVEVLSRALLEKNNVQADVILGLDNNISQKAIDAKILSSYKPAKAAECIPEDVRLQLGKDWQLTPFDYSHFAMIYDTQSNVSCPASLEDLTKPEYEKKIILMDPRTSTPGLGFVAWTVAVYGDKVGDYWKALKPNILTMAPGWSAGYGLFKQGEAPLVISYTTSPASHVEYDNTDRYVAAVFEQGHSIQVEGAGILAGAPNRKGAEAFMDFLISEEAQELLPLTQWMNPANKNVKLPESYQVAAPIPAKTLSADPVVTEKAVEAIMKILEK
ncbi:MAG: thiamine ABC transporter substrate-binding protein [Treponema sp.]|nr:thiamine ABC transporter substrate-binding protein [Treponema sp.]